ncbi:MAG: hypothetical protein MUF42_14655 [Cytophagaceae bacterium]|jgi:hypothetical protein|nr:hypothetical protein [Cytophagaceae bacterium]
MKDLGRNWLTEGLIDFEYKKYILLAYLQGVRNEFQERKLYPVFAELLTHYRHLVELKQNKSLLRERFPKELSGGDFEKLEMFYKELVDDDKVMSELEEIMEYSIPKLEEQLNEGKDIYEEVENGMSITPVGLYSLNASTGFMMLYVDGKKETKVYEYEITIFENAEEKFRGVHTQYLESIPRNQFTTYESIKVELSRKYPRFSNPATYLIDSKVAYPLEEALLPIAKRMLVRFLSTDTMAS